jgi:uncharacterized iron-regulated protein
MRRISKTAITLGLMIALGGPAASQSLPDFDSFMIVRAGGGAAVSAEQAADALKDYDVIFLGELHDHIAGHLAEMALLRALQARVPKIALSMEQFERDVQPVVDDYLAGKIGEETLKTKGRAWNNYAEAYRPLVEFAKDHDLPVIAANAPESVVRCVAQEGAGFLATLSADKRDWAAAEIHTEDGRYKQKYLAFLSGDAAHGEARDAETAKAAGERSFAAQVTRDDTMAESIANYLHANPGHKIVHVTGAFHVEARLGTIERLKLRAPNLKIALILPVETANPLAPKMTTDNGADFAILLRPEPEAYVSDAERQTAEARESLSIRAATSGGCKL